MKKWRLVLTAGVMTCAIAACGKTEPEVVTIPQETTEAAETQSEAAESEAEEKNENFEDLEEKGAEGEVAAFAEQIQEAVAAKDMEAMADLCSYPLAVNGEVVDNKDAFMELGDDVIFTEDRCSVIEKVDVSALEETMAGVVMGDATPNIIFKSVDGKLGIAGIN